MKNFVYQNSSDAKDVCDRYGFSTDILFNMLSKTLEEERWQWRENKVIDVIEKLTLDLTLVGVVNSAFDGNAESVEKVKDTLFNYLDYIKIPGKIYISLNESWAETVGVLHDISINRWVSYSIDEKKEKIINLQKHIMAAIENIAHPINVLKSYIEKNGIGSFSDEEYEEILRDLPNEAYSQTEHSFKSNIKNKIKDLDYTKKVKALLAIWQKKTGTKDVLSWTNKYAMPVMWAMPQYCSVFEVLYALGKNVRVDIIQLENALNGLGDVNMDVLTNREELDKCFVTYVASDKYLNLLKPHIEELKNLIQDGGCRDYFNWNNDIVKVRIIVEKYISNNLKKEVGEKAKRKISKIDNINKLKEELNRLIDKSSEACLILLDEDL